MSRSLGNGGYAVAINRLLNDWRSSHLSMIGNATLERMVALGADLERIIGEPDGIEDARAMLLAAESLVEHGDRDVADALNHHNALSGRLDWEDLHGLLDEAQNGMHEGWDEDA